MYEVYPANVRKWIAPAAPSERLILLRGGDLAVRAGLRRWTRHPRPPHHAHDQVVITVRKCAFCLKSWR